MLPNTIINTVQGNRDFDLNFTLTDSAGAIVDLTGATLIFNAQLDSNSIVQFSGNMPIVTAAAGTCKYIVQPNDLDVPGTYNCQIQVTYVSVSEIVTFAGIQVVVAPKIPIS